jgi:septal ring factor EnvC (AmiA/AmiB activator)
LLDALDSRAALNEKDRTELIREAIACYLKLPKEDAAGNRLDSLEQRLCQLHDTAQDTEERANSLEARINELSRQMHDFLN